MLIAQITDLHLRGPGEPSYDSVDTGAFMPPLVAAINRVRPRPDCVLASGDLTDAGHPAAYAHLRAALAPLEIPCYLLPGNHDDRANLLAEFPDHDYLQQSGDAFIQYTLEQYPLRIIALDTVVPGQPYGALCTDRLDWLADRLAEQPQRPTVIVMHHPPFATGLKPMDALGLTEGGPEMAAIVARYPNVERVLCGHLHRTIFSRYAGTVASTCPASAHQLVLDLAADTRIGMVMEPPGYHLHTWQAGALVTHHAVVGEYGAPKTIFDSAAISATFS